jgi:hypothetical protein
MLDKIQSNFKQELQFTHLAALVNHLANVFHLLQGQNMCSPQARNDALDTLASLLQQQKEVIVAQPQTTTNPA